MYARVGVILITNKTVADCVRFEEVEAKLQTKTIN